MFGVEKMLAAVGAVNGDVRFYGLTETNMNLEGIERHQRLITSTRSCMLGGQRTSKTDYRATTFYIAAPTFEWAPLS